MYEEPGETVNACENGTLNLLKILPEGNVVTARELHLLRKEFIQRVFTYYIVKLGAGTEEDQNQQVDKPSDDTSPML